MSQVVAGEDNESVPADGYEDEAADGDQDSLYIIKNNIINMTSLDTHACTCILYVGDYPPGICKTCMSPSLGPKCEMLSMSSTTCMNGAGTNMPEDSQILEELGLLGEDMGPCSFNECFFFIYRSMVNCRIISLYCHGQKSLHHHVQRSHVLNRLCRCCGEVE